MNYFIKNANAGKLLILSISFLICIQMFAGESFGQTRKIAAKTIKKQVPAKKTTALSVGTQKNPDLPLVTQIDEIALKKLLKRGDGSNNKPLLVNFWATWCDPCREEFPELVKINQDYAGKIDFITISLDDLAEIKNDVPKFLLEIKATMPAFLLKTEDEDAAMAMISKDYQGGLPFTILFNQKGEAVYSRQGKIKLELLRAEIEKLTP